MGLDFHTHSTASDGSLSPEELVKAGVDLGLDGIALTDHDTIAGLDQALAAGKHHGLPVIPGIELTTDYGEEEAHILGFGFDRNDPPLNAKLQKILESRIERARGMVERLRRAGVNLAWDEVFAHTNGFYVGRPHIYRALKQKGIIGEDPLGHAFNYYLGSKGIAYLPHQEIATFEAIALIRNAGGVPVLAHPGRMNRPDLLMALVKNGLAGIEVYYPSHRPQDVERYRRFAEKYDLLVTGGSDYHGEFGRTVLGQSQVAADLLGFFMHKCE